MGQTLVVVVGATGIRKDAGMYSSPLAAVQAEWRPEIMSLRDYSLQVPVPAPTDSKGARVASGCVHLPDHLPLA